MKFFLGKKGFCIQNCALKTLVLPNSCWLSFKKLSIGLPIMKKRHTFAPAFNKRMFNLFIN